MRTATCAGVFCHTINLLEPHPFEEFEVGMRLQFSVMETGKGLRATGIEYLRGPNSDGRRR